ncbi:MAG TPA: sulfotransferase domain-containing protein [Dongiaceae bacterium]|nr:sulfotransferase domain-containing protein [Dongiaceae bacterium]
MSALRQFRHTLSKTSIRKPLLWMRHRGFHPSDAFVGSYPRSGSTWLRFILVELLAGQDSGFSDVNRISPDVGDHAGARTLLAGGGRLIKTHEIYREAYRKAIYLVRDPRDVIFSEYAYYKALGFAGDDFDEFLDEFLRKGVNPFGTWSHHAHSWLDAAESGKADILVVRFEDMRQDTQSALGEMMEFLKVPVSASAIRAAVQHNSLDRMKAKEKVNPQKASAKGRFIGSGSVQGWRDKLTDTQLGNIERHAGDAMRRLGYHLVSQEEQETSAVHA